MIVNRDKYLQELVSSRHNGLVKIITGMRRCGKSFLLFRLFKRFLEDDGVMPDHIIEMAFDDYAFKEFRNPDKFYKYVKEKIADDQPYIIRKTKCSRIFKRSASFSKTKRNFSKLSPIPQKSQKNRPASPELYTFEGS